MRMIQKFKPYPKVVDVIVVGSGAAGFSAALTSAISGLEVILLEKSSVFGGTSAISGGAIWVPESSQAKQLGLKDSRAEVLSYLRELIGDDLQQEIIESYLDAAPNMLSFFEKHTRIKFEARKVSPDYHHGMKGTVLGGRTMDIAGFNGRLLGKDFDRLRLPLSQFTTLGGMMVHVKDVEASQEFGRSFAATAHILRIVSRHFLDRLKYSRGTRLVYGNALMGAALKSAIEKGIELRTQSPVTAIIQEEGKVTGVTVTSNSKQININIKARYGVVLAAGGGSHNQKWRESNLPSPETHISLAPKTNTGDMLDLAIQLGGYTQQYKSNAFLVPVSIMKNENGEDVHYPHLMGDRYRPGSIAIDSTGMRFTNESTSYHAFVEGMHKVGENCPGKPAYLICDQRFFTKYGLGLAIPNGKSKEKLLDSGYLIKAKSLETLSQKLEVPISNLTETIEKINIYAAQGNDPDFGKGSSEYNKYMGDKTHSPNPCLGEIKTAPYYAVKLWSGDFGPSSGLVTDASSRVLSKNKTPIENLYACGNEMNSIMSGFYPGGGITLGPGLTFGYLAAMDILQKKEKQSR